MDIFLCFFSALRAIKNHPNLETFAEIDKAVFHAGRHEQHIAGAEGALIITADKLTAALHHDIDLVL